MAIPPLPNVKIPFLGPSGAPSLAWWKWFQQLSASGGTVGPQGPAGPTGPQGPAGTSGASGVSAFDLLSVAGLDEEASGGAVSFTFSGGLTSSPDPITSTGTATLAAITSHAVAIGTGSAGALNTASPGTAGNVLTSNGASSDPTFQGIPSQAGRLIGIRVFNTHGTTTYTPTSGTNSIVLQLVGAGGGSSGIASPGAGKISIGRAGGGGAWLQVRLTSNFSGASYTVGQGGGGGLSGDNAGTGGGSTSFTTTGGAPVTYTAGGGTGGNNGGSGLSSFPTFSNSVAGGTVSGGDLNAPGIGSLFGLGLTSVLVLGGSGGGSMFGPGGGGSSIFTANATQAGSVGANPGAGGGAPCANGTGGAQAGAAGTDGMVLIYEFS